MLIDNHVQKLYSNDQRSTKTVLINTFWCIFTAFIFLFVASLQSFTQLTRNCGWQLKAKIRRMHGIVIGEVCLLIQCGIHLMRNAKSHRIVSSFRSMNRKLCLIKLYHYISQFIVGNTKSIVKKLFQICIYILLLRNYHHQT